MYTKQFGNFVLSEIDSSANLSNGEPERGVFLYNPRTGYGLSIQQRDHGYWDKSKDEAELAVFAPDQDGYLCFDKEHGSSGIYGYQSPEETLALWKTLSNEMSANRNKVRLDQVAGDLILSPSGEVKLATFKPTRKSFRDRQRPEATRAFRLRIKGMNGPMA